MPSCVKAKRQTEFGKTLYVERALGTEGTLVIRKRPRILLLWAWRIIGWLCFMKAQRICAGKK